MSRHGKDDLFTRAHRGEAIAVGTLLEVHRRHFSRLAAHRIPECLSTRLDPADVVQETFLEAHKSFPRFIGRDHKALRAWLSGIFRHVISRCVREHLLAEKRSLQRHAAWRDFDAIPASQSSISQRAIRAEQWACVEHWLDELPAPQREALHLYYTQNWSVPQLAGYLCKSVAAVAGLIKRGMHTLRTKSRSGEDWPTRTSQV